MIESMAQLEKAAVRYGMLPFFANRIPGFSVEEMAAPGVLFGQTRDDYGCWDWKGPVIQQQTTAYGKFFNRKAGFIALDLLADFIRYRRAAYPVKEDSTEQMILDIIRAHEGLTSTELKRLIFGQQAHHRKPESLVDFMEYTRPKRHSLEAPLQRLQMGAWLLIADFEYKYTAKGDRYGWGVALYSTPEIWFGTRFEDHDSTPGESFLRLVDQMGKRLPGIAPDLIENLIR